MPSMPSVYFAPMGLAGIQSMDSDELVALRGVRLEPAEPAEW